jgi:Protein of unknown function (DUF3095)
MPASDEADPFYASVPVFHSFGSLMEPGLYTPLPDDWTLGLADIVQSTQAIRQNRYKAVNMAGAAVIAAVKNALHGREFPYVFGGDGASFAVPRRDFEPARDALAATAAWAKDDLDLTMRVALVPVANVRAHGLDVRVARFAPSANVAYAMFSGGGLAWAEAAMKRGEFLLAPPPSDARPDLHGLSCRFSPIANARGVILSLLIAPAEGVRPDIFRSAVEELVGRIENSPGQSMPVPSSDRLMIRWPPTGTDLEVHTLRSTRMPLFFRKAAVVARTFLYYLILRYKIRIGRFVPENYLQQLVENSDFRKFDGALRMILDCSSEFATEIEKRLSAAASAGTLHYGLHRQEEALMTCFTPSPTDRDHVHFIDGGGGGYAAAASALKARMSA